jgi:hypothetical protein
MVFVVITIACVVCFWGGRRMGIEDSAMRLRKRADRLERIADFDVMRGVPDSELTDTYREIDALRLIAHRFEVGGR